MTPGRTDTIILATRTREGAGPEARLRWQEFRDTLSDGTPERGTRTASRQGPGRVQDESARHVVTLDEKDDQNICQDDALLRLMRRLVLWERRGPSSITCWETRETRTRLDYVLEQRVRPLQTVG